MEPAAQHACGAAYVVATRAALAECGLRADSARPAPRSDRTRDSAPGRARAEASRADMQACLPKRASCSWLQSCSSIGLTGCYADQADKTQLI
eukprot:365516-Chlamydomonas_euryale.AAC.3